ncbi:MAG: TRIC cation channel family protein, partial [Alistipes putredinis]
AAGGMLRDVLLNEVPLIFRKDIYAIACICGGLIYYLCMYLDLPAAPTQFIAACSVILIRILAVRYGISLPALKGETRPAPKEK